MAFLLFRATIGPCGSFVMPRLPLVVGDGVLGKEIYGNSGGMIQNAVGSMDWPI